jgi:hypothetical protein
MSIDIHSSYFTYLVLTLLSLTTKYAHTVTMLAMLVGTRKRRYRVRTSSNGLGNVFGKTHVTERSASARITVVALHPGVFRLLYLYFPKGSTMA